MAAFGRRPQDVEARRLDHVVEERVGDLRHDTATSAPETDPNARFIGHGRLETDSVGLRVPVDFQFERS